MAFRNPFYPHPADNRFVAVAAVLLLVFLTHCTLPNTSGWPQLETIEKIGLAIAEPSDLCMAPDQQSFYIVSDRGKLFHTDLRGQILRKAKKGGDDLEGVWYRPPNIYVVDESRRKIILFEPDSLRKTDSYKYKIPNPTNKGWESITYNPVRQRFVLFTERSPLMLYELDSTLQITRKEKLDQFVEISACTWHNDRLWVLSDEQRVLYRVDPATYAIETGWLLPVHNPEGVCFGPDNRLYILSDNNARLYVFDYPD